MARRICVLGSGSFGTALGCVLARNGHHVCLLARSDDIPQSIADHHINPRYFSDFILPDNLSCSTDPLVAFDNADYVLHAIPVQHSAEYLESLVEHIKPTVPIISCSKGLHDATLQYMSDLIPSVLGNNHPPLVFFSGPSFARELLEAQPSAVVVASRDEKLAEEVQMLFANKSLRVYTTTDVIGVEIGGALKNIFAIGAGMVDGMGFGKNSMAALVTRGCSEMRKLALAMGADPITISGLAGIGDLMLTCYGKLSRNRTVGYRLGKGESLKDIMDSMTEVAEGVYTTPAAVRLAERYDLDLPIIKAVASVLSGSCKPRDAVKKLMERPQTKED